PSALKHRLGVAAVVLSAAKMFPSLRTYRVDVRSGEIGEPVFDGRALQLIVGNTRLYGKIARMTPDALLDSGALDVSVISARSRLSALTQVLAILLRGRPAHSHTNAARSTTFRVSAPASVDLQLDGSAVKLRKYLDAGARDALARAGD